jgi:hypothetical protein
MAAVALQREIDAYSDAIGKYNQQARSYKAAATKHNASVDAYKDFTEQKTAGDFGPYDPRVFLLNAQTGELLNQNFTKVVKPSEFGNYYVRELPKGNSYGKYVLIPKQAGDMPAPGEFTKEQPTALGKAPSATTGQMRRLDAPSLSDIERTGGSGLISSAFNY